MKTIKENVVNFLNDLRKIMKKNNIDSISFENNENHHTIELNFDNEKSSIIIGEYNGNGGLIDNFELESLLDSNLVCTQIAEFDPEKSSVKPQRFIEENQ